MPANQVTLVRAILVGGVAVLGIESLAGHPHPWPLALLAAIALGLDALDGKVARRTGTVTAFGARFDMEVDAFLILVLSVVVAPSVGWWVLLLGAARYVFVAFGRLWPWLRGKAPPRPWCKVVAAVVGVALTVTATEILPRPAAELLLAICLCLLAESFGREAWELWRRRATADVPRPGSLLPRVTTVAAALLVWAALVLPDRTERLSPEAFLRLPVEALLLVGVALWLPPRAARVVGAVTGLGLAVLALLSVLDLGFGAVLDRPFDPTSDWTFLRSGVGVLGDSLGNAGAITVAVGAGLAAIALLVALPLAVVRLLRIAAGHRAVTGRAAVGLALVWCLLAVSGLRLAGGEVASAVAATQVYHEVTRLQDDLEDRSTFAAEIEHDRFATTPESELLRGLRGKDVLLVFVESYGRVAVEGTSYSPGIDAVLEAGTDRLRAAGYSTRSAFLTSPTFGAASWLAHSTTQSGLWVDSERRYSQLLGSDRLTLSGAFHRAGWRTVLDIPANTGDWTAGVDFYGVDALYDSRNVGYHGPEFGYAPMPDQYVLEAFRQRELTPRPRQNVMAEIDLVSSHHPWAPLPHLVPWEELGDGSVFDGMPEQDLSSDVVFRDPDLVRDYYGRSVEYTWQALTSFLTTYRDPNLVLVVLGDHQPHSYVSGEDPGHDVPISVIAQDPQVLRRIDRWGWDRGLLPDPAAPVWRMDRFRDRFLHAYR